MMRIQLWSLVAVTACLTACASVTRPAESPRQIVGNSNGEIGLATIALSPDNRVNASTGVFGRAGKEFGDCVNTLNGTGATLFACPLAAIIEGVGGGGISDNDAAMIAGILSVRDADNKLRDRVLFHAMLSDTMLFDLGAVDQVTEYNASLEKHIETVLEIGLMSAEITSGGGSDPVVRIKFRAQARLVRIRDRIVLWSNDQFFQYAGVHKQSELRADGRALLSTDVDDGLNELALAIVYRVFRSP